MNNIPKIPNIDLDSIFSLGNSESIKVYESKSDSGIWNPFNNEEDNSFNYIYQIYVEILFEYCFQFYKVQNQIQDCIQSIFIDLRRKFACLSEVHSIRAFQFKIHYRRVITKTNNGKDILSPNLEKMYQSFLIAFTSIQLGKQVYCQKPVYHNAGEIRELISDAVKVGIASQFGLQHASSKGDRKAF